MTRNWIRRLCSHLVSRRPRQEWCLALHPHAVLLHRDTCHKYVQEVAEELLSVIGSLSPGKAARVAKEAWSKDQAVVVRCPRELAEFYRECLRERGLAITIEPC
jgi:ATP-dependent Clp protease adaptor protein ClpS